MARFPGPDAAPTEKRVVQFAKLPFKNALLVATYGCVSCTADHRFTQTELCATFNRSSVSMSCVLPIEHFLQQARL